MLMSTTNIDRVTTMQKVANKTHKTVIHDLLLSNVMQLVTQKIPNALNSSKVYVYMPTYMYWLRNKPEYRPYIEPFEQKMKQTGRILREGNFIMNIRISFARDIETLKLKNKVLDNCCVVWSLWNGYKEEEEYKKFLDKMKELHIDVIDRTYITDTGDYTAFKQLFDITKPDIVIPIHTEDKYKIKEYTDKAVILNDMETLEINQKGDYKIIMNENIELEHEELHLPQDELIVIGARQGNNLTTIGLQIADNISRQNKPVAIFSLEYSKQALLEKLENTKNIYIDDTPNIPITYIEEQTKQLIKDHNIKLVIIDCLQKIKDYNNTEIIKSLRTLAKEQQICIILLSQQTTDTTTELGNIKNKSVRDLIDSFIFLYEEDDDRATTYEEVITRLKGKKLEDYTREDVNDRYIAYGNDTELNTPKIQRLLIKHKFYNTLMDSIDVIEDRQTIQELLSSNLFKDTNYTIMEGRIINVEKEPFTLLKNEHTVYNLIVTFEEMNTNKQYKLKAYIILEEEEEELERYKKKLKPYLNNVAVIVMNRDNDLYVGCYLKYYEDIDYKASI